MENKKIWKIKKNVVKKLNVINISKINITK